MRGRRYRWLSRTRTMKYDPVGFPPVMGSSPNPSFQDIGLRTDNAAARIQIGTHIQIGCTRCFVALMLLVPNTIRTIGEQAPQCWKSDGAARNGPNGCIETSEWRTKETKLNYILVGRLCNLESPWVVILQNLTPNEWRGRRARLLRSYVIDSARLRMRTRCSEC